MEIIFAGKKKINALLNNFEIKTDLPEEHQGENTQPSPYDLFLASMGCCAGIFIKNYCDQRGLSVEGMKLEQNVVWSDEKGRIGKIMTKIYLPQDFPQSHETGIIRAANICKVKKQLHPDIESEIEIIKINKPSK